MQPTLADLEDLARQAGEILRAGFDPRPGYGRRLQVDYKGTIDLVTEMDHRAEELLIGEIQRRFPSHRVMAEESGALAGDNCCLWYIDPIDGTVNYAHGVPIFCVSIGYAVDGVVQFGVVYDPIQDECFSAARGQGAHLNDRPVRASAAPDLDHSLLSTGFPYNIRTTSQNNLDYYARFSLLTQGVRRMGSAALDLCYVAAGRLDGFWELSLNAWDVAAGALIASEAGAVVTTVRGDPDVLVPPNSILAANPYIHARMLQILAE